MDKPDPRKAVTEEDHETLVNIYQHILDRLLTFVPPRSQEKLITVFDVPFFAQLLKYKQFNRTSLHGLTNTTFDWVHNLQMPIRDSATAQAKQRVLICTNMVEAVGTYVDEVHGVIDTMQQDMDEFYNNMDHPVVQQMLKQAIEYNCSTCRPK